jgi:hypothetical protein
MAIPYHKTRKFQATITGWAVQVCAFLSGGVEGVEGLMDVKLIEGDMVQFDETITKTENQRP